MRLIAILLALWAGGLFGCIIWQPVAVAAKSAKGPRQFFLSDLFWLSLLLQYPLGFLAVAVHWHDVSAIAILGGSLLLVVVAVWYRAVTFLSRIGVDGPVRRGVFIVLVVPVVTLGSLFSIPLVVVALASLGLEETPERPYWVDRAVRIGALMLPLAAYAFRRLVIWVLAGARSGTAEK